MNKTAITILLIIMFFLAASLLFVPEDDSVPQEESPDKYRALANKWAMKIRAASIIAMSDPTYEELIKIYKQRYADCKEKEEFLIKNQEKI